MATKKATEASFAMTSPMLRATAFFATVRDSCC
jgi:hypothetical protein